MRFLSMLLAVFGALAEVNYQPAVPQALMPDGTPFLSWSDVTRYTRTYHVSQNNPQASDDNDGTEEHPFRTINHAAQVVKPGERVWIHAGIYRELVRPRLSGEGPDRMIAYEAAPGEQVIIRGSRVITTRWELSADPNSSPSPSGAPGQSAKPDSHGGIYSKQIWMTTMPDSLFEEGYSPFQTPNLTNQEFDVMDWAVKWKGRIPYTLPRGLLFQDGRRMAQLAAYEDLVRLPGSYWVDPDGKTVHIHPFGGGNPNGQLFEAAVQPHIIQPQNQGLGFIRVSGLILEQCANGFARAGVGALFTMGGHHWIIEGNTVRQVNSVGIEVGFLAYEGPGYPRRTDPDLGYNIIRRNSVSDCGTAGIRGLNVSHALVEDNDIVDCGWQDVEFHWEVAGIKLLVNRGTLVRNNHIARLQGSAGIWLDWDNQNSRITGNVIHDINTVQGAVFIEASQSPNLVDHNVFWNINGEGVRLADTDNAIVAHNFFGHVSQELVWAKVATTRSLNGRRLTSTGNRIVNNVIVDQGKPMLSGDPSNVADYNVYASTKASQTGAKDSGEHSVAIQGTATFDADRLLLIWKSDSPLPTAPILKNCESDFFRRERTRDQNIPGPFLGLANPATFQLREAWK
ncbi:MAG: right-handed parallel beta-helix repeat-containing protein [Terriglobia bacterium]